MMELREFLDSVTSLSGLSGSENEVASLIAGEFKPYADEVSISALYNVTATLENPSGAARHLPLQGRQTGPTVMIVAHEDEIGLMVLDIEDDGAIRITRVGGVDPRILPAAEVRVMTKTGPLFGVVGAKPPHLLTDEDRKKSPKIENMYVDVGLSPEKVKQLVRPGDRIALVAPVTELKNGVIAGKTMDDRACVAAMLEAAKLLKGMKVHARVAFVASAQEEVGSYGAQTACWEIDPDCAIALDVTHAQMPGCEKWETQPMDKAALCTGPTVNPTLESIIRKTAEANRVEIAVEAASGDTYTDADPIITSRGGVPTALISIPVKYMHTTVETLDINVIKEVGRLLALSVRDIAENWGDIKWF